MGGGVSFQGGLAQTPLPLIGICWCTNLSRARARAVCEPVSALVVTVTGALAVCNGD